MPTSKAASAGEALVAALFRREARARDAAEARAVALRQLAEEAITMLAEWDESMAGVPSFGHGDGTTAKDLAARLAKIGGGE